MAYAKRRNFLLAAVAAALLLLGAGVAFANGEDSSGQSTGPGMEKAKSVALEQVNGRVTATEFQDEEGYYEVEVTKSDGSQVDVHLDKNFNVLDTPADSEGHDGKDAPNDGGG
ncbi:MAG TPA: PepSY domain-containing protein [Rubrobacter sp.]